MVLLPDINMVGGLTNQGIMGPTCSLPIQRSGLQKPPRGRHLQGKLKKKNHRKVSMRSGNKLEL